MTTPPNSARNCEEPSMPSCEAVSGPTRPERDRGLFQLDRPVCGVEERLPASVLPVRELEPKGRAGLGLQGFADQADSRLLRGAAPFTDVAFEAGADDVVPGGPAPLDPGDDVVEAQLAGGEAPAAVLAAVAVAG